MPSKIIGFVPSIYKKLILNRGIELSAYDILLICITMCGIDVSHDEEKEVQGEETDGSCQ